MANFHPPRNACSSSSRSDPSLGYGPLSNQPVTNTPPHFVIPELFISHETTPPPIPPVPPKPSAPPHNFMPLKEESGDVRNRRDTFPTPKKSKNSSSKSFTRRLLNELNNIQHEHSHHQSHHHHGEDSPLPDSSPTNSHPTRSRHRSYSRARSSSESMSALLVVTTERLAQETARANEAERQAAEVLAVFKTTHEAKTRLEREINRVREELGLYKIQLDLAQKGASLKFGQQNAQLINCAAEIFRAQEVVNKLERQRVDAEDEAVRSRDKLRELKQSRAVEQAMEEGRRLGFEEGLKQGRFTLPDPEAAPPKSQERRLSAKREGERPSPKSDSSGSARSFGTTPRCEFYNARLIPLTYGIPLLRRTEPERPKLTKPISQPVPTTSRPRRPSITLNPLGTPDVARYPQSLPIRTVTTPMDVRVPSTQPQPPQPMPPHQPLITPHAHGSTKRAESVESSEPIHPIPIRKHSPSVSHRSIVLPPDNYIPTLGPDSLISLPPPHELSQPVPPVAPPIQTTSRSRSNSRAPDVFDNGVDYESRRYADRDRRNPPPSRSERVSVTSRGSTRLSELDLLGPPRNGLAPGESRRNDRALSRQDPESPTLGKGSRPRGSTQPITERIVEQWRNANPEYQTPSPSASRQEEIEIRVGPSLSLCFQ